uniref:uroporphyrinogen-III synthase n=1 Tax=Sphingobacterium mizutaii TaxID=1010 RepID=UPI0016243FDF
MKARILFTKELSKEYIQQQLGDHFDPLFLPVTSINPVKGDINTGDCKHFIFTSIQGVKAIKESVNFPSDAQFYVVGEKSRHALEALRYSVKITAKNALEL